MTKPTITRKTVDPIHALSDFLQAHKVRVPHGVGSEAHTEHCPRSLEQEKADEEDAMWRRAAAYVRSGTRLRTA